MRAIEFRAWANNTMYYFVELASFKDGSLGIGVAKNGFHDMHTVSSDVVLMQYTGLKDAKGNKIFEGDLIKNNKGSILTVVFDRGAFGGKYPIGGFFTFSDLLEYELANNFEVIGNKYQHGEFLNEQK